MAKNNMVKIVGEGTNNYYFQYTDWIRLYDVEDLYGRYDEENDTWIDFEDPRKDISPYNRYMPFVGGFAEYPPEPATTTTEAPVLTTEAPMMLFGLVHVITPVPSPNYFNMPPQPYTAPLVLYSRRPIPEDNVPLHSVATANEWGETLEELREVRTLPANVFANSGLVHFNEFMYMEYITEIPSGTFQNLTTLEEISLPTVAYTIGSSCFQNCTALRRCRFTEGVANIGNNAFKDCTSLMQVSLLNIRVIGNNAFDGCTALKSVKIGQYATSIGTMAFHGCTSLWDITISNYTGDFLNGTFGECRSLRSITFNGTKKIMDGCFYNCVSLREVNMPNTVTQVAQNAFMGCSSLSTLHISTACTSVGQNAFSGCVSLQSLTIPASVTSVGQNAFYGCKNLTEVMISSAATIGANAFMDCPRLQTVSVNSNTPPTIDPTTFNVEQDFTILVPQGALANYTSNASWAPLADKIQGTVF